MLERLQDHHGITLEYKVGTLPPAVEVEAPPPPPRPPRSLSLHVSLRLSGPALASFLARR